MEREATKVREKQYENKSKEQICLSNVAEDMEQYNEKRHAQPNAIQTSINTNL